MTTTLIEPRAVGDLIAEDKLRRLHDDFFAGLKPNTLRTYRQCWRTSRSFVGAADARSRRLALGRGHGEANHLALAYRANMVGRDLSANTINNRLAALRSLVKLARTLGLIGWTIDVGSVKARPYRDTAGCGADGYRGCSATSTGAGIPNRFAIGQSSGSCLSEPCGGTKWHRST